MPQLEKRRLARSGWRTTEPELEMPVLAAVVGSDLVVVKVPSPPCAAAPASNACRATRARAHRPRPPETIVVPLALVDEVQVHEPRPGRTVLLVTGIVLGTAAAAALGVATTMASLQY